MSLSKQFSLSFLFVLTLVFLGTVWINVNSFRDYVSNQLASHSQDAATSLGLSISPYMGSEDDLPLIETMMNAIFDSGYYLNITLYDTEKKVLLEKVNPETPVTVPSWFASLFPLNPPMAETEINNGWYIAGSMTIVSHPGVGYDRLWDNAKETFLLTFAIFLVGSGLLYGALRVITTPIIAVVDASKRISARDFSEITKVPKTRELNLMVKAINKMAGILNKQHVELTSQAESYYQTAYIDGLTKLGNKLAMDNKLSRVFADEEMKPSGFLIIVRLSSLAMVNEGEGAEKADNYIKTGSDIMSKVALEHAGEVFRVRGGDFVILFEHLEENHCKLVLEQLSNLFSLEVSPIYSNGFAHVGAAHFDHLTSRIALLENADAALTAARHLPQRWQMASQLSVKQSQREWREQFNEIIENKRVDIARQPVKDFDGQLLYFECFARFKSRDQQSYLPMPQVVSESEYLHMAGKLDLIILEKILTLVSVDQEPVAVNLSTSALSDKEIINDIINLLRSNASLCPLVTFEIHEMSLQRYPEECIEFAEALRQIGVKLTLERVGSNLASFSHLKQLRPDHIKLDGSLTRKIEKTEDNQFYVRTLVNIAHGLNIKVIVELVETLEEAQTLHSLYVDFTQGYLQGKPEMWV